MVYNYSYKEQLDVKMVMATIKEMIGIDETTYSLDALTTIRNWYKSHVSTDEINNNDNNQSFNDYIGWTKFFLNTFMPLAKENLTNIQQALEDKSPLMFAARYGWDKWLENNATASLLNEICEKRFTLLQMAVAFGHFNTTSFLLNQGLTILDERHKENPLGHLALFYARNSTNEEDKKQSIELLLMLCKKEPKILEITDDSQDSIFHRLAQYDYGQLLPKLLQKKDIAKVMVTNNHGQYPHFVALLNGNDNALSYFLQEPSVTTLLDTKKRNIFHYIARGCTLNVFYTIKQQLNGINIKSLINQKDYEAKMPKDFLLENPQPLDEITNFFNAHGAKTTILEN